MSHYLVIEIHGLQGVNYDIQSWTFVVDRLCWSFYPCMESICANNSQCLGCKFLHVKAKFTYTYILHWLISSQRHYHQIIS